MVKILVVDDEKETIDFCCDFLDKEGFKVLTATNGPDALRKAAVETPDLILLDINMPEMDGGDVAQRLSENESTKEIPILFLSGMVTRAEEGRIKGRYFISKLSSAGEIVKKIKKILAA